MMLGQLLTGVPVKKMFHTGYGQMVQTKDVTIRGIHYDSRRIEREYLFVAIRGTAKDGHRYISDAVRNGASAVVLEDDESLPDPFFMHTNVAKIVVEDSRRALAVLAANFYGHPAHKLQLVGVTGTNGKTTTTYLIRSILEAAGEHVGLIGTIKYNIGKETLAASHTTPESLETNQLLAAMAANGCTSAVLEVSSHSLVQQRVYGLGFKAATFTNLTQDHLDFHGSMEEYCKAKKMLFDDLAADAWAISNADDPYGNVMISTTAAQCLTYGIQSNADVIARDIVVDFTGTKCKIKYRGEEHPVSSPLIGRFNVSNILAAYATCASLGVSSQDISRGMSVLKAVRGRFEQVRSPHGWTAVIDYAHTPDALENCLKTIREILPSVQGRVITVFGCGGNRDRTKRKVMGAIASELSDVTIITSDNPRSEDPELIARKVLEGARSDRDVRMEVDRKKAIVAALGLARRGDVVLIAGKGHETYQVIGDSKEHFDDLEEVERFINQASWSSTHQTF
jgi:UDP-N-acetylmuramoyl-L-alanyl-D-glutamate--2,6-diaminopimelate ligase